MSIFDYEYAEIHSRVLSVIASARSFATKAGSGEDEIKLYIDQEIQKEFSCINIEEAGRIRAEVLIEQARRAREGKKPKKIMNQNGKKPNRREEQLAEVMKLEAEIARLKEELSKPEEPKQFSCKWFSVQKVDGDAYAIRTLGRYGRTYLGRMNMPLEKVNTYAENIKNLIETVIDERGM